MPDLHPELDLRQIISTHALMFALARIFLELDFFSSSLYLYHNKEQNKREKIEKALYICNQSNKKRKLIFNLTKYFYMQ